MINASRSVYIIVFIVGIIRIANILCGQSAGFADIAAGGTMWAYHVHRSGLRLCFDSVRPKKFRWRRFNLNCILSRCFIHIYRTGLLLYPDRVATDHFESGLSSPVIPVLVLWNSAINWPCAVGPSTVMTCHEGSAFSACHAGLRTVVARLRIINTSYPMVTKSYAPLTSF